MSLFQKYQLMKLACKDRSFRRATLDFVAEKARFELHSAFPKILCVWLVEGCNLRCAMCGQWRRNAASGRRRRGEFLPLEKVKDLVDEAAVYNPEIYIWGGEPTLHPEFGKVLSVIKRKRLVCTVNTNGLLLQRLAKEILESRVDSLYVSLDGLAEVHDKIRGRKGTYARVMKGLAELHKNGAGKRPLIRVVTTLSKANLSHVEQLLCELVPFLTR